GAFDRDDLPALLHGGTDRSRVFAEGESAALDVLRAQREAPEPGASLARAGGGEDLPGLLHHLEDLLAQAEEGLPGCARGRRLLTDPPQVEPRRLQRGGGVIELG